ncbi:hypothetical protein [Aurantiacibacter luteus]|uniref:hypothetical protein n=1 Tax=Aurantiacibacter luteus TaxID=1581420 RepID=UPI0012E0633A|nr:hypothetical protein [Aurantiacibacter luteus]
MGTQIIGQSLAITHEKGALAFVMKIWQASNVWSMDLCIRRHINCTLRHWNFYRLLLAPIAVALPSVISITPAIPVPFSTLGPVAPLELRGHRVDLGHPSLDARAWRWHVGAPVRRDWSSRKDRRPG